MQEFDIIELKDFNLDHLMRHFDECENGMLDFNDEYECIEAATECIEEILWN